MYDYASDAVKRALPTAKFGGPHTTGLLMKHEGFILHCKELMKRLEKSGAA
jgi:xylan 1,4-beta-xylosidase